MWMYPRLLGIVAVMSGLGLSEALPAGDVWKGSWKFEIDRRGPSLGYYDSSGKRMTCRTNTGGKSNRSAYVTKATLLQMATMRRLTMS